MVVRDSLVQDERAGAVGRGDDALAVGEALVADHDDVRQRLDDERRRRGELEGQRAGGVIRLDRGADGDERAEQRARVLRVADEVEVALRGGRGELRAVRAGDVVAEREA